MSRKIKIYIVLHGCGVNIEIGSLMGFKDEADVLFGTPSKNFTTLREALSEVIGEKRVKIYRMCPPTMVFMSNGGINETLREGFFKKDDWQLHLHPNQSISGAKTTPVDFANTVNLGQTHIKEEPFAPVLRTGMQSFEEDDEFLDELLEADFFTESDRKDFGVYIYEIDGDDNGVWTKLYEANGEELTNHGNAKRQRITDLIKKIMLQKPNFDEYEFLLPNCSPSVTHGVRKEYLVDDGNGGKVRRAQDSRQNKDYWRSVFNTTVKSCKIYESGKQKFRLESRNGVSADGTNILDVLDVKGDLITTNHLYCQMDDEERQELYININAFLFHYPTWVGEEHPGIIEDMKYLVRVLTTSIHDMTSHNEHGISQETRKECVTFSEQTQSSSSDGSNKRQRITTALHSTSRDIPKNACEKMFKFTNPELQHYGEHGSKHTYVETLSKGIFKLLTPFYFKSRNAEYSSPTSSTTSTSSTSTSSTSSTTSTPTPSDLYFELIEEVDKKGFPTIQVDKVYETGSTVQFIDGVTALTGVVVQILNRGHPEKEAALIKVKGISTHFTIPATNITYISGDFRDSGIVPPPHTWVMKVAFDNTFASMDVPVEDTIDHRFGVPTGLGELGGGRRKNKWNKRTKKQKRNKKGKRKSRKGKRKTRKRRKRTRNKN